MSSDPIVDCTPDSSPRRVWLLFGHKAGDNHQLLALAEALGWPFEEKTMVYRPWELVTNLLGRITLAGIHQDQSSRLEAPWPDLVLTAGRRNEPIARWIAKQSDGHTRIVHVGRPWASLDAFDLIVTTPQYFLPDSDNVLNIELPLHSSQSLDDSELQRWEKEFSHLPRPYTAVFLGGDSGPFVFTLEKAKQFAYLLNQRAVESGGSLLISSSARTPEAVWDAFMQEIDVEHHAYQWLKGSDNPYRAMLEIADDFSVTGESMSMLTEASVTGKPLTIFDLSDACSLWWLAAHNFRYKPLTHRLAMSFGPQRMRRDISKIQQLLIESGRAIWLNDGCSSQKRNHSMAPPDSGVARAAERVRSLFQ